MSTITININASLADLSQFADELGYQTEVGKTEEELALLVEPIAIQDRIKPNPISKQQFLESYFKDVVVSKLYAKKASLIDAQVNTAKELEKEQLKSALSTVVGVSSII